MRRPTVGEPTAFDASRALLLRHPRKPLLARRLKEDCGTPSTFFDAPQAR